MANITISIDDSLYTYLNNRRQNMSLQNYVEKLLRTELLRQEEEGVEDKISQYKVSEYIKSLQLKGESTVPSDENGIEARTEKHVL